MDLIQCERYLGADTSSKKETDLNDFIDNVKKRKKKREDASSQRNLGEEKVPHAHSSGEESAPVTSEGAESSSGVIAENEICKSGTSGKGQSERSKVKFNELVVAEDGVTSALKTPPQSDRPRKNKKKRAKSKSDKAKDQEVADWSIPAKEEEPDIKYEVLGNFEFTNKNKVKRVLPRWLAEPVIISDDVNCKEDSISVISLKHLNPKLKSNLVDNQILTLFPVQSAVIPYLLSEIKKESVLWSRDICVSAPTGSGKTLAYAIPLLQAKSALIFNVIHALVIVPVQELALQVCSVFKKYAKKTNISVGYATGGTDYEMEARTLVKKKSNGTWCSAVDILVATPGRLVEHMLNTEGFNLQHLRYIVIDEADRVMEQRSLNWLHMLEKQYDMEHLGAVPAATIYNLMHRKRRPQKWLFSATLSQDPEKLLQLNLFQPKLFTSVKKDKVNEIDKGRFLGKFTVPGNVSEYYFECSSAVKPLVLIELMRQKGWSHIMCFTKSCEEARRLTMLVNLLNPNLEVAQVTTLLPLPEREKSLEALAAGCVSLLVCSDRVARGMDIPGVDYVVLYDPPKYAKGYVHRIGRTGRAGTAGTALTLVTPSQTAHFIEMLKAVGHSAPQKMELQEEALDSESFFYKNALDSLNTSLKKEHATKIQRTKLEKRKGTVIHSLRSSKKPKSSS